MRRRDSGHAGYTLIDLLVVLVLVSTFFVILLLAMPRGREQARLTVCQKNLGQIGLALALYNNQERSLPTIVRAGAIPESGPELTPGPLLILLETFGLDSFQGLSKNAPLPSPGGPVPGEIAVPGFLCASDPHATVGLFEAPISYRAATGGDLLGLTGAFAPGRTISLEQIEQGDGTSYTAGFSERLVGNGTDDDMSSVNYATVTAHLPEDGCTRIWIRQRKGRWRGDSGSSWRHADYRSTLYNHAMPPAYPVSCAMADGQSALMIPSSGHERGVNLLMLDGSVRLIQRTIAPPIWKEFATLHDPAAASQDARSASSPE